MKYVLFNTLARLYQFYLSLRQPVILGVASIVVTTDRQVLLVRHSYVPGWHIPGGKVERGESILEAAQRELREEVGVQGTPQFLGLYHLKRRLRSDHIAVFVFECWKQSPKTNIEIAEQKFFAVNDLPQDISRGSLLRIQEWFEKTPPRQTWT